MRLFAAISLTTALLEQLLTFQRDLAAMLGERREVDLKWLKREQLHLTLKFFGEVRPEKSDEINERLAAAARGCASFDLRLEGCGCFPEKGPARIIWAGCPSCPPLEKLYQAMEDQLERIGVPKEKRDFSPHITMARVKRENGRVIRALLLSRDFAGGEMQVQKVDLFQSTLKPDGAEYQLVRSFPFPV